MKFSTEQRAWLNLGLVGGLTVVSLVWWLAVQRPSLESLRLTLDTDRINLATFAEQRSSRSQLEAQAAALTEQQASLATELWRFASEPEFFSGWDSFGRAHRVTVEVVRVADVVPGNRPVRRNAELVIEGAAGAIFESLNALASLQPLVAIQRVQLQAGSSPGQVAATLEVETVWQ